MPAHPATKPDAGIVGTPSLIKDLTKPRDVPDSAYQQRQDEQVRLLELALRSSGAKR